MSKRGNNLAHLLNPYIGTTDETRSICSRICRLEPEYTRIQEAWCNDDMPEKRRLRTEAREAHLESLIRALVEKLPHTDAGPFTVVFSGDPRGYCVRIKSPDAPRDGNTWGLGGEFGV